MKSQETNEEIARRAIEEIWNQHNADSVDVLYAPNYKAHDQRTGHTLDRESLKQAIRQAVAAVPNARLSIERTMAQGDRVAVLYSVRNGNGEAAPGSPSKGRPAAPVGALGVRIVRGQIRESWGAARMVELWRRGGSPLPLAGQATT